MKHERLHGVENGRTKTFRGAWNSLTAWPDWPRPPVSIKFSNFVHITGGYCLRIKNYAGMRRMSQIIISCEKIHPHLISAIKWKNDISVTLSATVGPCHPEQLCLSSPRGFVSTKCTWLYYFIIIIGTDDVVRRHRYCDHFVTMCVCVCVCVLAG